MIRSMTGFGQGAVETHGIRATTELRCVNHRFLDVRFRLPSALAAREQELRRVVAERVRRGRVEIGVTLERTAEGGPAATLNRKLVEAALAAAETARREFGVDGDLDVATLLRLPGMLEGESDDWPRSAPDTLERALRAALDALDADRLREGEHLVREILERLEAMQALVGEIRARAETVPLAVRGRLEQRIEALSRGIEVDPSRLAQEVAFLAERYDVTEEVVRLTSHLAQARSLLDEPDGEPVGKRMDFLLQEILRETNTINSKASDLEIGRRALALKNESEKVREQVQNLE